MHPLTKLVCGPIAAKGAMMEVLTHLGNTLDQLLSRTSTLRHEAVPIDMALFGPMLGRAAIEVSLTAILGRFDPFRVLAIRRSQVAASFDPKQRNPLAFTWTNDVQGDERPKPWDQRPNVKEIQRALLCKHFNDVFWQEAFTNLLDEAPSSRGGDWMARLRKVDPEGFTVAMRSRADRIYSELSKGVHHEFVIPAVATFDIVTVNDLVGRSWELIGTLGLTACFSPALPAVDGVDPLDEFEKAQQELESA